jgi:hypothetical protein
VWHFYDTEFGFGAKHHTNDLKTRLSVGVVTFVKHKDGTIEMTKADFEKIISDWAAHLGRTPMKEKRTASWARSINSAPCNADVTRAPEREVIESLVAYLNSALSFPFPEGTNQILAGHFSDSVDLPALEYLAREYCDFDMRGHFDLLDTKSFFPTVYPGLGSNKLQKLLGFEADGGNLDAAEMRDRKSAHLSAKFDAEATGFLYFLGEFCYRSDDDMSYSALTIVVMSRSTPCCETRRLRSVWHKQDEWWVDTQAAWCVPESAFGVPP